MDLLAKNYSADSSPSQSQVIENKQETSVHTGGVSAETLEAEWNSFETSLGTTMVSSDKNGVKEGTVKKTVVDNDMPPVLSPQRPNARRSSSASSDRSKVRDKPSSSSSSRSPSPSQKTKENLTGKARDSSSDSEDEEARKTAVKKKSVSRSRSKSRERQKSKTTQLPKTRSKSRERSKSEKKRSSKSRSRSRSKAKHRRRSRSRSHDRKKRSRSRSPRRRKSPKRRRSRSKERKDSKRHDKSRNRRRSREKKSRSRSRDRHRRRRSQSKERRRKHHSRSRSKERRRSRSHNRDHRRKQERTKNFKFQKNDGGSKKPLTFKDALRAELLKAAASDKKVEVIQEKKDLEGPNEKPSNLPLNSTNMFTSGMASLPSGGQMTPQLALLQTMAAMHQKAQELTGVAVPKYYNPAAVNPLKYAEQIQKRKLLWSATKEDKDVHEMEKQWEGSMFTGDQDGKVTDKFRKLMGIKPGSADPSTSTHPEGEEEEVEEKQKQQQEYFQRLDRDYEFARMTTHTHRGVGLGFTSQGMPGPQFPPT